MKKIAYTLLLTTFLSACGTDGEKGTSGSVDNIEAFNQTTQRVSKEDFKAYLEANGADVVLVDVRTPEEYSEGTIKGAVNHDFLSANFKDEIAKLDKNTPVLIFCQSGGRSGKALEMMKGMGFSTVLELDGGYSGW